MYPLRLNLPYTLTSLITLPSSNLLCAVSLVILINKCDLGVAWYDQDFEADLIDILRKYKQRFLIKKTKDANEKFTKATEQKKESFASANQVLSHIKVSGILKIAIGLSEIESILQTLVLDSLVEKDELNNVYRALEPPIKSSGLMSVPCGICPVFSDCSIVGKEISPINCVYMDDW